MGKIEADIALESLAVRISALFGTGAVNPIHTFMGDASPQSRNQGDVPHQNRGYFNMFS